MIYSLSQCMNLFVVLYAGLFCVLVLVSLFVFCVLLFRLICLFFCIVCLFVCLFTACVHVRLFVCLLICLFICLLAWLFVCFLFVCCFDCLFVCLFALLVSVCFCNCNYFGWYIRNRPQTGTTGYNVNKLKTQ